ncbi:MAG: DUF4339 domain-containing protein [Thermoguttaceae bacterium]|nr:DUF4339 domain-containing protein [Thermoguttaceae bacterium]
MAQYYIKVAGRPFGPLSSERVLAMIAAGKIQKETELSLNRLDWKAVREIAEFSGAFATAAVENSASESNGAAASGNATYATGRSSNLEPKEWCYSVDGRTGYGPYRISELLSFLDQNKINFDSLVWREGEGSRPLRKEPIIMAAYEKTHYALSPVTPEGSSAAPPAASAPKTPSDPNEFDGFGFALPYQMGKIRSTLNVWHNVPLVFFFLGMTATIAFAILAGSDILHMDFEEREFSPALSLTFLASVIFPSLGMIPQYFFVYYLWQAIPPRFRRTTPLRASLFLLIPFFNYYWLFVAFVQGADCLDRSLNQFAQKGKNRGERPVYAYGTSSVVFCVFTVLTWLSNSVASNFPIVLFFIALQPLAFWIFMRPMKRAAFQILSWRSLEPTKTTKTNINDLVN